MKYDYKNYRWTDFLAPKYWLLWALFFFLYTTSHLPYPAIIWIGKNLGRLAERLLKKYRHIVAVNLKLCFPEKSQTERETLAHQYFESVGIGFMEIGLAWWASDKRLKKLATPDPASYAAVLAPKKGVLVLTGHFTSLELAARYITMIQPAYAFLRPQNNLMFQWFTDKQRSKYMKGFIYKSDIKQVAKLLMENKIVCYLPDQNFGHRFAPFFGIPAATSTVCSRLIKMTNATLASGFCYRINNKSYSLELKLLLENFLTGDDLVDAAKVNSLFEQEIRKHPEQYWWAHRRFKTRPEGEKGFY